MVSKCYSYATTSQGKLKVNRKREVVDPATAKQKTVVMISRRKCGRRGEDTMMGDDDGNNNAQTQQSYSTH
jgi:IS4 transposase